MVATAPKFKDIYNELITFIGTDYIVGHNVSFDLNFIVSNSNKSLHNDYIDTLYLSRLILDDLSSHRLTNLAWYFKIDRSAHRSVEDCLTTKDVYDNLKREAERRHIDIRKRKFAHKYNGPVNAKDIAITDQHFDEDCLLYDQNCVFTGTLKRFTRKEAMEMVVNIGGHVENTVTKKTNFLILGDFDYCKSIKDGKTNKHKKALELQQKGQDIEVIDEFSFYDMLNL